MMMSAFDEFLRHDIIIAMIDVARFDTARRFSAQHVEWPATLPQFTRQGNADDEGRMPMSSPRSERQGHRERQHRMATHWRSIQRRLGDARIRRASVLYAF